MANRQSPVVRCYGFPVTIVLRVCVLARVCVVVSHWVAKTADSKPHGSESEVRCSFVLQLSTYPWLSP